MTTKFTKKDGWWKLRDILDSSAPEEFTNNGGSFRGEKWHHTYAPYAGRMDPQEYNELKVDAAGVITYVVWSYQTPVAWRRLDGSWHVTDANYSQTTKCHLGKLRTAIAEIEKSMA